MSLPKTTSGNIHGAVRRGSAERRASQALDRLMARRILPQGQMRSEFIVVAGVGRKDPAQMGLAQDDDVIKAFPADRADQSLRMPVLPG